MGATSISDAELVSIVNDLIEVEGERLDRSNLVEQVDIIHRGLMQRGLEEESARLVNRQVIDALRPPLPKFQTFELFLTRWCNLDCSYCFVHDKTSSGMTPKMVEDSIQFILREASDDQDVRIVFMGGEPSSRFPLIKQVVRAIARGRQGLPGPVTYDITSNGTLLTEEMMRFFREHRVKVLLSLDGDRKTHDRERKTWDGEGSFDTIVEKLPMMLKYQPYLGTKMTPTPDTVDDLLHDVQTLTHLGIRHFIIGAATGIEWSETARAKLAEQIEMVNEWAERQDINGLDVGIKKAAKETASCNGDSKWGCRAGISGLAIDVDGAIYPCSKTIGTSHQKMHLGNVEDGITNTALREQLCGITPTTREGCWTCGLKSACYGGCYAANMEATGDPFVPAPSHCAVTESLLGSFTKIDGDMDRPTSR